MNANRRVTFLVTVNVLLLVGLVVSVLTAPQPVIAQGVMGEGAYAMVAGEVMSASRSGQRQSVVYVADLRRSLVVALSYDQVNQRLEPMGARSMARDAEAIERAAGEGRP